MQGAAASAGEKEAPAFGLIPFDLRLDDASPAPIAVGLSGGGDSLALLTLALDWARPRGRRVLALTVDHRLQAESPAWTARAGEQALRLGAEWRGLAWTGPKPLSGIAAVARRARHALLAEAAREAGASVLLLGHTADDVAESERMRAQGSTLGALRDWSPSPVWPEGREVFLFRPVLDVRRAELRQRLRSLGLDWIEDPANADPRSLRARVRAELAQISPSWGETADRRSAEGGSARAGPTRTPLGGLGPPLPPKGGDLGVFAFPQGAFTGPRAHAVLAVAIVCAAGREQTPRGPAVDRLLRRLEAGDAFTAVLAGARVEADGERVWIFRESGEAARGGLRPVRAEPGRPVVWDGRFEITANQPCEIRAAKGLISQLDAENQAALKAWPAAARAGLPVAVRDDNPKPLLAIRATRARDLTKLRHFAACGLIAHEKEITGLRVALTR